ncbi:hypothetical protein GUJ93_ZPchr0005g14475 [Zizania palustris]|uniref:Uncharacterized protein n=1 Tax=Zizania palustris TaxID=103762 RepID=A0A8J5VG40_ZIZPA|nr:hypothetical protein GUJ93_ZPchr0005g14475 [Zizania palustris]
MILLVDNKDVSGKAITDRELNVLDIFENDEYVRRTVYITLTNDSLILDLSDALTEKGICVFRFDFSGNGRDESPPGPDITNTGGGAAHSRPRANSATFAMSSLFLMLWMATVSSHFKVGEPGGRQHWWRAVATSGPG